jgi:hypothetical protein
MPVMTDWRALLGADGSELMPGARPEAVGAAEYVIGLRFPDELRSLYLASDGVFDADGQWWVIWPLRMLTLQNAEHAQGQPGKALVRPGDGQLGARGRGRADGDYAWRWLCIST